MNWKIFTAAVFILGIFSCVRDSKSFSENNAVNDSLDYFFEQANIDTLPYAKRLRFTEKALAIVEKQPNDSMNRVNYFKVANRYWNMKALNQYRNICKINLQNAILSSDKEFIAKSYAYLGDSFLQDNVDSSYFCYCKAEKLYQKLNNNFKTSECLIKKAELQSDIYDFSGAEKSIFKALKNLDLKDSTNYSLEFYCFFILGGVYERQHDYDNSYKQYVKCLKIAEISSPSAYQLIAKALNGIGLSLQNKNLDKAAIKYFEKALNQPNLYNDDVGMYCFMLNNLAYSKLKMKVLKSPKDFINVRNVTRRVKNYDAYVNATLSLAEYYEINNDTLSALKYNTEAYEVAKKLKMVREFFFSLQQLSRTNFRNAHKYYSEYFTLQDSVEITERRNRNKFARIEFETEELAKQKNQLIAQKHNYIITAITIFTAIVTISLLGFILFKRRHVKLKRQKQKAAAEIYRLQLDQQQKIEEGKQFEKRRIAQELHDGVMGKLTSIRLNLFVLNKRTDDKTIEKCLQYIDEIQIIEKEIRTIAYELHNDVSDDFSIEPI